MATQNGGGDNNCDKGIYELFCSRRFDMIDKSLQAINETLTGEDGDKTGLCERVRTLERIRTGILCVIGIVGSGWLITKIPAIIGLIRRIL